MDKYNTESNNQNDYSRQEAYLRAKKKLDELKGFFWHLASYIVVNIFLITMIAINLDEDESIWNFGTFATALFWGVGLMFHFLGVFGPDFLFGKGWEERKINEYMEKDKRKWE